MRAAVTRGPLSGAAGGWPSIWSSMSDTAFHGEGGEGGEERVRVVGSGLRVESSGFRVQGARSWVPFTRPAHTPTKALVRVRDEGSGCRGCMVVFGGAGVGALPAFGPACPILRFMGRGGVRGCGEGSGCAV